MNSSGTLATCGSAANSSRLAYGSFSRSFTLPAKVDSEKVEAKFKNGLLTVSVPRAEEIKPRQIKIN